MAVSRWRAVWASAERTLTAMRLCSCEPETSGFDDLTQGRSMAKAWPVVAATISFVSTWIGSSGREVGVGFNLTVKAPTHRFVSKAAPSFPARHVKGGWRPFGRQPPSATDAPAAVRGEKS